MAVAGRMMLRRQQGKLIFATMRDRSDEVQLFVSKAVVGDDGFAAFGELDLGDWVGVEGTVMTTRKGELSVKVDRVELLAKAVRPMPDKWHGLTDTDTRFRQRYADLIVNEEARRTFRDPPRRSSPASAAHCTQRASSRSRLRCCTSRPAGPTPVRS